MDFPLRALKLNDGGTSILSHKSSHMSARGN